MSQPVPSSREAEAVAEIAATEVRRATAWALLAVLGALWLVWLGLEGRAQSGAAAAETKLTVAEIVAPTATPSLLAWSRALGEWCEVMEEEVDRRSAFVALVRPWTQLAMTKLLHAGNAQVTPGRDGWLLFNDDLDHLTGRGLDPQAPEAAIAAFDAFLRRQGIRLVVVPVPVKPSLHPEVLRAGLPAPLRPQAESDLLARLAALGIELLDPAPLLAAGRAAPSAPLYLERDTHWRPEAVELVARSLAARLRPWLGEISALELHATPRRISGAGDTLELLGLPAQQTVYANEEVSVRAISAEDGAPLHLAGPSPVLLLGDSFTNVYSLAALGWGTGAGLGEQLSFELGLIVDRLAVNAGGAHATRVALARELAAGSERLVATRVVVWQFSARELSLGEWRPIDWKAVEVAAAKTTGARPAQSPATTSTSSR